MALEISDHFLFSDVEDFDASRTVTHAENSFAFRPGNRTDGFSVFHFEKTQHFVVTGVPGVDIAFKTNGDEILITPV